MNYIKAINAFYDQQEFNPLSASAITLWHGLMHVNNKSRWKKEFSAAMTVLCVKTGLSEAGVRKARKELVEKGCLTFQSRKGNQAPIYQIVPLYEETGSESDKQEDKASGNWNGSTNGKESGNRGTLIKQNETKENETKRNNDVDVRAHDFYETNIGPLTPFIAKQVTKWAGDLSDELVVEALKRAILNNRPFFSYAEAILKDWQTNDVRSLDEARSGQVERLEKGTSVFDKLRRQADG
ncbi:DnaD domain protein [Halobacillus locisalis]|uniref:DnaD domain protein n=1 Tax=Halobacillus locisalis TaxID=220753 RepID=A0A838CSH9_9BACI|nr:DnaD domain protein [Halobacillus locisalis]MBA2174838.1 DnaD domain protein [Halobacillus locisalis]